jgi:hypothetical protein
MKLILLFISFLYTSIFAQPELNSDQLIEKYFKDISFPDKEYYLIDEMSEQSKAPSIGEELAGSATINYYPIQSTSDGAVYNINIKKEGSSANFYCYLVNEKGWKISAIRKFILPVYIYSALDSLSGLKNPKPQDESLLKTLQLITSDDQNLKDHLKNNLPDYTKLIQFYKSSDKEKANELMHKLGSQGIFEDKNYPGCVFIPIGSVGTSEAGYFFTRGESQPIISPNNFIYIEKVAEGWYVYKLM